MNPDETEYMNNVKQMKYEELLQSFSNLKHIGMDIVQIELSTIQYYNAFHNGHDEKCHICKGKLQSAKDPLRPINTSIPWRKELMKGNTIVSESDPVQTD